MLLNNVKISFFICSDLEVRRRHTPAIFIHYSKCIERILILKKGNNMKTKNELSIKLLTLVCGLFLQQSVANACSASQGAVADNARSLGISYLNLAIQYATLTGNTYYKGVAATAWQNQLSWRAVFNAATNRAECYKATLDLQHWTAQMNNMYSGLASVITALQQSSSTASSAASSTSSASSQTSSASSQASSASSVSSTSSTSSSSTQTSSSSVDYSEVKENRIVLIEKN